MDYLVICLAAVVASGLTLFSGFGLGTLLMPVFALFFPVETAIALTALVHFLNNLFKLALVGRFTNRAVVLRFGVPAIFAAFVGAKLLVFLSGLDPMLTYTFLGKPVRVMPVKLVIAILLVCFAAAEVSRGLEKAALDKRFLILGGLLSGFFGGLSGNQGALRSPFLLRTGLTREAYIATGVVIACLVDLCRVAVYGSHFYASGGVENLPLLAAATASAFGGAFTATRFMHRVTMRSIQLLVSVMLFGIALGLGTGLI